MEAGEGGGEVCCQEGEGGVWEGGVGGGGDEGAELAGGRVGGVQGGVRGGEEEVVEGDVGDY